MKIVIKIERKHANGRAKSSDSLLTSALSWQITGFDANSRHFTQQLLVKLESLSLSSGFAWDLGIEFSYTYFPVFKTLN